MPLPTKPLSLREQIVKLITDHIVMFEGEPPDIIIVIILSILQGRKSKFRFRSDGGEPARLSGYGARLDEEDDWAILRILADATEPMQGPQIARAMGKDAENSTPRVRLRPNNPLRAGGFVGHVKDEGYYITDIGRNALESSGW